MYGRSTNSSDNYHVINYSYDKIWDTLVDGTASIQYEYNDGNSNKTSETYYDKERNYVIDTEKGYASINYEYTETGEMSKELYYDDESEPVKSTANGAYGVEYNSFISYDDNLKVLDKIYLDDTQEGSLLEQTIYTKFGKISSITHYEVSDNEDKANGKDGYWQVFYAYGNVGNETGISYSYIDDEGHILPYYNEKLGYSSMISEYDNMGNTTAWVYYMPDELTKEERVSINPIRGYARIEQTYDNNGNWIQEA